MLNNVTLVGRLTKDVDMRYTPNGIAVANFTLAVERPFKNSQGDREADFINCVIWRKPAEIVAKYCNKGSMLGISGRVQTRSFDGQDGKRVFITEILVSDFQLLQTKNNNSENNNQNQNNNHQDPFKGQGEPIDIHDDDLPF